MAVSKVTVHFPCSVERVWQVMTDLSHTAWRSDLKRVEVLDETHFVEHTKTGYATRFTVTACEPLPGAGSSPWRTTTCPVLGRGSSRRQKTAHGSNALKPSRPSTGGCFPLCPVISSGSKGCTWTICGETCSNKDCYFALLAATGRFPYNGSRKE